MPVTCPLSPSNFCERCRDSRCLFFTYVSNIPPIFSAWRRRAPTRLMTTFDGLLPQRGHRSTNSSKKSAFRPLNRSTKVLVFCIVNLIFILAPNIFFFENITYIHRFQLDKKHDTTIWREPVPFLGIYAKCKDLELAAISKRPLPPFTAAMSRQ